MNTESIQHHPIFDSFQFEVRIQSPGWQINGLGVRSRDYFADQSDWNVKFTPAAKPNFDESYFEWVDVLTAVRNAKNHFRMIEVGAGYGPWITIAGVALKQTSNMPFQLIGIEAEPTRFKWMKEHLLDNNLPLNGHHFYCGLVNGDGKSAWFDIGDSNKSYGATVLGGQNIPRLFTHGLRGWMKFQLKRRKLRKIGAKRPEYLSSFRLSRILEHYPKVDLVDMDIQGSELEVIKDSIADLNKKVKSIHIGTHSNLIESELEKIFKSNGWENIWNFHHGTLEETPFGKIRFSDGVQTWVNPEI
jgi:FkbM family methyltransferase